MEPAKTKIRINYVVYSKVKRCEEMRSGWYVQFEGSWESLLFGIERPQLDVGDEIKITFEKVDPCPPSPTTNPTTNSNV